jgi:hypothetical protein
LTPSSIKVKVARVLELIVQEAVGVVADLPANTVIWKAATSSPAIRKSTPKCCAASSRI